MTTNQHTAFDSIATILSTELNSLANNANSAASSELDNGTTRRLFLTPMLSLAATSTRTAGGLVALFMIQALDGTNYPTLNHECDRQVASWPLDAATTARPELATWPVEIPPGKFKFYVRNVGIGVSFASSASLVEYRLHGIESV